MVADRKMALSTAEAVALVEEWMAGVQRQLLDQPRAQNVFLQAVGRRQGPDRVRRNVFGDPCAVGAPAMDRVTGPDGEGCAEVFAYDEQKSLLFRPKMA